MEKRDDTHGRAVTQIDQAFEADQQSSATTGESTQVEDAASLDLKNKVSPSAA